MTFSDTRSPNDLPGMKTHQLVNQWVGLVSELLLFIFAALLFMKQRSENRLRELEDNPPAPADGQNRFVAVDVGTEQRNTEVPLPNEQAGHLEDHRRSPRAKKNQ